MIIMTKFHIGKIVNVSFDRSSSKYEVVTVEAEAAKGYVDIRYRLRPVGATDLEHDIVMSEADLAAQR